MKRHTRTLLLAAAMLSSGTLVMAQPMGHMGDCPMQDSARSERQFDKMREHMAQRMEKHLASLKTALKLTPAQEPAWNQFVASHNPPQRTLDQASREEMKKLTTPQRIEKMQALRAEHEKHMDQRIEALKQFYGTLTPEQQKAFDAQPMLH